MCCAHLTAINMEATSSHEWFQKRPCLDARNAISNVLQNKFRRSLCPEVANRLFDVDQVLDFEIRIHIIEESRSKFDCCLSNNIRHFSVITAWKLPNLCRNCLASNEIQIIDSSGSCLESYQLISI